MALNIYQRLNEIRKEVAYLRKEKEVTGYKVITHDQVTGEIRESLIKHGVMIVPRLVSSKTVDTGTTTSKGIPIIRYEPWFELDFVNIDEPSEKVIVPIEAHALDQGDKAPGKAISYATKYAMLKLFSIESGEDEEDRPEVKAAKSKITPRAGAGENLTKHPKFKVQQLISTIVDCIEADVVMEAAKAVDEANLDVDEKIYMWDELDSKQRRAVGDAMAILKNEKLKSQEAQQA
jgi:hypothetical protein